MKNKTLPSVLLMTIVSLLFPKMLHAASVGGANTGNVPIPDAGGYVSSTIAVSGAPVDALVTSIDVFFKCSHPYSGDLVVDLNADSTGSLGNKNLWNREGGAADNPSRTTTGITTFNRLSVNRTWYLYAKDFASGDSGYIDEWTIIIHYDDVTPSTYAIAPTPATVGEGAGTLTFTITRSGGTPAETVYASTTQAEGFVNNGDYAGVLNQPVSFTSGQTSQTVAVTINDDSTLESSETFGFIVQRNANDPSSTYLAKSSFSIADNDDSNLVDYPGATWIPAGVGHFTAASRSHADVTSIVIHTTEDAAYGAAISWFQDPAGNTSAHYLVRRDGSVVQLVRERDIAHHAGVWLWNQHSIGIEVERLANATETIAIAQYAAVKAVVDSIRTRLNVPLLFPASGPLVSPIALVDGIVGHGKSVANGIDPVNWDWAFFQELFRPVDGLGPAVAITSPANSSTVSSANLTVIGTATDSGRGDSGVSSVVVNGVNATGGTASGGNTAAWSATITLNPGVNTITAVTRDVRGNTGQAEITVTYNPDVVAPAVAITSPANNSTVSSASLTVIGTATDSGRGDSGISSVMVNGVNAIGGTASGGSTAAWSTVITLNPGMNTITAVARDSFNNSDQAQITVTYNSPDDSLAPVVVITSPTNNATVFNPSLTLIGTATDSRRGDSGVSSVMVNGVNAIGGTASGGSTAAWSASITLNPGANMITVVVKDDVGNSGKQQIYVTYAEGKVGAVIGWGANASRQCDATPGLKNVIAVSAGDLHSLALKNDGLVAGWGYNSDGQTTVPSNLAGVVAVAAGGVHSIALKGDGTVVAWGYNGQGQANVPPGLTGVVAIAAGYGHNLSLKNDGSVIAWGYDGHGEATVPSGLSNVIAISAGSHSLALKQDGKVVAWGYNAYGQASVPVGLEGVAKISAGKYHSLALKLDGTVVAWGAGMTTTGNPEIDFGQSIVPTGLREVVAVAAGGLHSLALKRDGTVIAWGRNAEGAANVPRGAAGVLAIAGGGYHSLALVGDAADRRLTEARWVEGVFRFKLHGVVGSRLVVQYSPDLTSWNPLATNVIPIGGWLEASDSQIAARNARFFRAIPMNAGPLAFQVIDIGNAGEESGAEAVNDKGQVIGWSSADGIPRAILWTSAGMSRLNANFSTAADISLTGRVVGQASFNGNDPEFCKAVSWDGGSATLLYDFRSGAIGVNDNGLVVGRTASRPFKALLMKDREVVELPAPTGNHSAANKINNNNLIVGWTGGPNGGNCVIWTDPSAAPQQVAPNGECLGVNDRGEVVGMSDGRAFSWSAGNLKLLEEGGATSINEAGWIVGWRITNGLQHAFLFRDDNQNGAVDSGEIHDLNDFLPVGSGWELLRASDVNNFGTIVGTGKLNGRTRAFVLFQSAVTSN